MSMMLLVRCLIISILVSLPATIITTDITLIDEQAVSSAIETLDEGVQVQEIGGELSEEVTGINKLFYIFSEPGYWRNYVKAFFAYLASIYVACLLISFWNARIFPGAPARAYSGEMSETGRESGTVKWFNTSKGFGFITRDKGDDIFVHYRSIRGEGHRSLSAGQRVDFAVINGDKGLQADDVQAQR